MRDLNHGKSDLKGANMLKTILTHNIQSLKEHTVYMLLCKICKNYIHEF